MRVESPLLRPLLNLYHINFYHTIQLKICIFVERPILTDVRNYVLTRIYTNVQVYGILSLYRPEEWNKPRSSAGHILSRSKQGPF